MQRIKQCGTFGRLTLFHKAAPPPHAPALVCPLPPLFLGCYTTWWTLVALLDELGDCYASTKMSNTHCMPKLCYTPWQYL